MSMYRVIVTKCNFVLGVHHNIRASSEQEAISIVRMFYPPQVRADFRVEDA